MTKMSGWKFYAMIVIGVVFLLFIWPTPYIIVKDRGVVGRVNRFTGIREIETDAGWRTRARLAEEQEAQEKEYASEFEKVSAQIQFQDEGEFEYISVKNPTEWSVDSVQMNSLKIEYYSESENGSLILLGNDEDTIHEGLPARSQQRLVLTFSDNSNPLQNVRSGTVVVQKVRLEFNRIHTKEFKQTANLSEPFVIKTERYFNRP